MGFLQQALCASPGGLGKNADDFLVAEQGPNECDYDKNPTQLYQLIEAKAWRHALQFMVEGTYVPSTVKKDLCRIPYKKQASIWVTRYERGGEKIRWSHIPLHAAIIFGAPYNVVKKLVELYPDGVRCADDQAMLPLHLVFKHLTDVHILRLVMDEFPDALFTQDNRGRLPSDIRQDERSVIIQKVISSATARVKQQTEERDTKEITELRKALLEQRHEAQADEGKERRHRDEIQERDGMIELLHNKIQVLQLELANMEKKSSYSSFPFMNTDDSHDFKGDTGFQLRKSIELQAENEELKEKVRVLQKELAVSNKALQNQTNHKNTIRIDDNDVLRFTELSDGMLQERKKYEEEKRKSNVLEAENKRLKEEVARISTTMTVSHRMYDTADSAKSSSAENRAPNKERFPTVKMAPVGIGSKDLESFLETRLLQELDVENRRLEKQLAANKDINVGALLNKQSRLQEMTREVKQFQGNSYHLPGNTFSSKHQSNLGRSGNTDDQFLDEYNRVRSQARR